MSNIVKTTSEIAKSLDENVSAVLSAGQITGFQKAFMIASAIEQLKGILTDDYMRPIMAMQGNKLGFKSDKVYPQDVVKHCLIEAVLMGVQPFGNQFNIIASNTYITKEGFGYLLQNFPGLYYEITPQLPRIKPDNSGAAIVMRIEWTLNGVTKVKEIDFPIKMNQYMGTDAVIGKAERKARAWLHKTITGSETPEGEAGEFDGRKTVNIDPIAGPTSEITLEELKALYEKNFPVLGKKTDDNAKRIISSEEVASYDKIAAEIRQAVADAEKGS